MDALKLRLIQALIPQLIEALLRVVGPDQLRKWADAALDIVENRVMASGTKYDDLVVLPLVALIRATFNIPDDDVPQTDGNPNTR